MYKYDQIQIMEIMPKYDKCYLFKTLKTKFTIWVEQTYVKPPIYIAFEDSPKRPHYFPNTHCTALLLYQCITHTMTMLSKQKFEKHIQK